MVDAGLLTHGTYHAQWPFARPYYGMFVGRLLAKMAAGL